MKTNGRLLLFIAYFSDGMAWKSSLPRVTATFGYLDWPLATTPKNISPIGCAASLHPPDKIRLAAREESPILLLMKKFAVIFCPLALLACQPKHSPENDHKSSNAAEKQPSSAVPTPDSFIGLTLEAAAEKATKADLPHRVVNRDGEDLPVTRDYRPERLNFTVEKGIIKSVTNG